MATSDRAAYNLLDRPVERKPSLPGEVGRRDSVQLQRLADAGDPLRGHADRAPHVDGRAPEVQAAPELRLGDAQAIEKGRKRGTVVHDVWTTTHSPSCPYPMDEKSRYGAAMPIRETMAAALRARHQQAGLSLEQVARRVGVGRSLVHAVETNVAGDYLDRLESMAAALGARWDVLLVPAEGMEPQQELLRAALAVPLELVGELLAVVRAWPHLTADDRDLVAHLCARRAARDVGEIVALPESAKKNKRATA